MSQTVDWLFRPEPIIWVQEALGLGWPLPWKVLSLLGGVWGILLVVALALWFWGRRLAYALVGIVALEAVANQVLNLFIHVDRPSAPGIVKYEHIEVGSFPSGHQSTAMVLWGLLWARGRVPLYAFATLMLLHGIARIYLGVHYVTDVVGAILIAIVLLWLFLRLWPRVSEWLKERPFALFAAAAGVLFLGSVGAALFVLQSNPFAWRSVGLIAGGALALPLEYRYVRYQPAPASFGRKALRFAIGTVPVVLLLTLQWLAGEDALLVNAATVFTATLWALLAAPAIFATMDETHGPDEDLGRTTRTAGAVLMTIFTVLLLVFAYGTAVEPRLILDVETETASVPALPPAWAGQRIAVIGDFQLGLWLDNDGTVERAVARIVEERPAAVLLLGDFVWEPDSTPAPLIHRAVELVRPLGEAGIPTFAVLGNHDWGLKKPDDAPNRTSVRLLRDSLRAAGIVILHNQATTARAPTDSTALLYIAGIGSKYADEARPAEALRDVPDGAPRIVFMHNPDVFEDIGAHAAPLAVAGHTHGGQVRMPFFPEWSWLALVSGDEVHADGWIEGDSGAAGNRLYVNRGIGMSTVPIRINCPPELTFFTLQPDTPAR